MVRKLWLRLARLLTDETFPLPVTITLKDETFQNLADGKVNGQKVC